MAKANQLAAQNRHEEALHELARCLRLVPGDVPTLLTKIQIEAHLQRYDDALDSALLVLAMDPACKLVRPSIAALLGVPALAYRHEEVLRRLQPRTSDASDAAVLQETAAELMPAFARRADEMTAAGSLAAAGDVLQRYLSLVPGSVAVRLGMVRLRMKGQRLADALDLCLGVLDDDPANEAAVDCLAEIMQRLPNPHRLDDVGEALARHLKAKPDSFAGVTCVMHWVDALIRSGGVHAAAKSVELALGSAPDFQRIRSRIASLLTAPERPGGDQPDSAAKPPQLAGAQTTFFAPSEAEQDAYDRLVALNVVVTLADVMRRFYTDIGYDLDSAPLVLLLAKAREHLRAPSLDSAAASPWPLLRFEAAWNLYLSGEREKSIQLLRTVADDPALPRYAKGDRFAMEALVRSGEIVGRWDERAGDVGRALSTYRRTMQVEESCIVAARMALLRWRKGDIRGAMDAADSAVLSKSNLFPRLPVGPYMSWLHQQLVERGRPAAAAPNPNMSAG